ncbi:uncharacterized protein [Parasteatoda tepidariorum]|uniref:uncharacterized protein n=1 Tax=Parasteatoda tepidariorum TaxID=114398 RepID=UPI00077FA5C8|nr:uncharacterized protein LOC107449418 [Parasteatoda tepidariorum]
MIGKIVFLCFMCGVALAGRSANQYIDNVLRTQLPQALRSVGLDPAPLPGFNTYFGPQGIYQNQGEAVFSNGNATNLGRLERKGDCSGPKLFRGEISINCTLRLTQITTAYKVIIRNGSYIYTPRNMGHVAETLMTLEVTGRPQNYLGSVQKFRVDRLGQITPTFSSLPAPLNKYLKVIQDAYRTNVSSYLFNVLQNNYVYALGRALSGTPMPRQ